MASIVALSLIRRERPCAQLASIVVQIMMLREEGHMSHFTNKPHKEPKSPNPKSSEGIIHKKSKKIHYPIQA